MPALKDSPPGAKRNQPKDHPARVWMRECFLPYQLDWILDEADVALALKSRQIGFSDATAARAVHRGFYKKKAQIILSANQLLADEVLAKAKAHCRVLANLGEKQAGWFTKDSASEIKWPSGGRIISLPSNPRTARSFAGDVYLDEAAFHQDLQGVYDAAAPMASRGGYQIRILSTPNGAQGLFHDWAKGLVDGTGVSGWSFHHVTIDDAIRQGLVTDLQKLLNDCGGDERIFNQNYRCSFLDANFQYIPTVWADRALAWTGSYPDLGRAEIEWYAGLDVGRVHDLTVLTVLAKVGEIVWVVAVMCCPRTAFKQQKKMIFDAQRVLPWEKLFIDCGGLGTQLAEELVEEMGEDVAIPVMFTEDTKEDMATRALRWYRDNRIRLPKTHDGKELRDETIALRRIVTKANSVVYDVPRGPRGHGDRLWSMLLALIGAGEPPLPRGMGSSAVFPVA